MPRKKIDKSDEKNQTAKKTKKDQKVETEQVEILNFNDIRRELVALYISLRDGKKTASEVKSMTYICQTLLSCVKLCQDEHNSREDSIRDLVDLIREERANQSEK